MLGLNLTGFQLNTGIVTYLSNSSGVKSTNGAMMPTPALLTKQSTCPIFSTAKRVSFQSLAISNTVVSIPGHSLAKVARAGPSKHIVTTLAPHLYSDLQTSRPIPGTVLSLRKSNTRDYL